jgi:hypothetical protein
MHGHLFFKLRQVAIICILNQLIYTAQPLESVIMADDNNTILCHSDISLQELSVIRQCVLKCLECVFWLLPAAPSMRHDHLSQVGARLRHFKLRPSVLQEQWVF